MNFNSIHPVSINIEPETATDGLAVKYEKEISTRAFIATLVAGVLSGAAVVAFTGYLDRKIAQNRQIPALTQPIEEPILESK